MDLSIARTVHPLISLVLVPRHGSASPLAHAAALHDLASLDPRLRPRTPRPPILARHAHHRRPRCKFRLPPHLAGCMGLDVRRRLGTRPLGLVVRTTHPPRCTGSRPRPRPAPRRVARALAARPPPRRRPRPRCVGPRRIPQSVARPRGARTLPALGRAAWRTTRCQPGSHVRLDRMAARPRPALPRVELSPNTRPARPHSAHSARRGHRAHRLAGALEPMARRCFQPLAAVDLAAFAQNLARLDRLRPQPLAGG